MVKREELSIFVERRRLATLPQPNELQSCLAYWAWELPMNTLVLEYLIRRQVIQGVVVRNMHLKFVFVAQSYVHNCSSQAHTKSSIRGPCTNSYYSPGVLELSTTRICSVVERGRRQGEGEIEGDSEHGPTSVQGSHHSVRIEHICCQCHTYITSL